MRRTTVWILSLVLVLGVAGMALAAMDHATADGTISAVDAQAMSFTIKVKDNEETFKLADKATLTEASHSINFADLKTGDWVKVAYTTSGSNKEATHVTVLGVVHPKMGSGR
jgi:hypothetical protein